MNPPADGNFVILGNESQSIPPTDCPSVAIFHGGIPSGEPGDRRTGGWRQTAGALPAISSSFPRAGSLPARRWLDGRPENSAYIPHIIHLVCVSVISSFETTTIMSEKNQDLAGPPASIEFAVPYRPSKSKRTRAFIIGLCLGALGTGGFVLRTIAPTFGFPNPFAEVATERLCPQAKVVTPRKYSEIWENLLEKSATDEYQTRVIEWLSGAVRIPYVYHSPMTSGWILTTHSSLHRTESHDHMGPVCADSRWEVSGPFHDHLVKPFPSCACTYVSGSRFHSQSTLSLTEVNTRGLVYAWFGSGGSLQPILLADWSTVGSIHPNNSRRF